MVPAGWEGDPVVRGDVVTVAGRHSWLAARAVDYTVRALSKDGVTVDPEVLALRNAFAAAAASWREGETFAQANMRMRDEDPPVMVGEMNTSEVAAALHTGPRAVQARAARGTLPSRRVGRLLLFDPADVERAVQAAR